WIDDRQLLLSDMRFLINHYWGSYTIAVLVLADYGPVFLPNHRLQMHHSSHSFLVLKMEKPIFSCRCVYPCPLMGPIDCRIILLHDHLSLVRAVYIFGPQYELPTSCDSAGRRK